MRKRTHGVTTIRNQVHFDLDGFHDGVIRSQPSTVLGTSVNIAGPQTSAFSAPLSRSNKQSKVSGL